MTKIKELFLKYKEMILQIGKKMHLSIYGPLLIISIVAVLTVTVIQSAVFTATF